MKPLRRVWRIERKDNGRGPWNGFGASAFDGGDLHNEQHPSRMPPPYDDMVVRSCGKRRPRRMTWDYYGTFDEYRYGFPSLGVLTRWCGPHALRVAHDNGCVLKVFGADWDRHILFENQIIFDPRFAVCLKELSLLEVKVELERCQLRQMAA